MKRAALVCFVLGLGLVWASAAAVTAEEGAGQRGLNGMSGIAVASANLAYPRSPETMGFTLAGSAAQGGNGIRAGLAAGGTGAAAEEKERGAQPSPPIITPLRPVAFGSGSELDVWAAAITPEVPSPGVIRGSQGEPAFSWAFFRGKKNGDIFTSLHEEYAWRMKFKSMTLGLGFFRSIPLGKGVRIKPYIGVIRSSLSLRPAGLNATNELYEYQLTAFCFGLPLVFGF
jgi:hypothetical protein